MAKVARLVFGLVLFAGGREAVIDGMSESMESLGAGGSSSVSLDNPIYTTEQDRQFAMGAAEMALGFLAAASGAGVVASMAYQRREAVQVGQNLMVE